MGYLRLLTLRFEDGHTVLEPHNGAGGAYSDLAGTRVYGIKYYGASTGKVFGLFAEALAETDGGGNGLTVPATTVAVSMGFNVSPKPLALLAGAIAYMYFLPTTTLLST